VPPGTAKRSSTGSSRRSAPARRHLCHALGMCVTRLLLTSGCGRRATGRLSPVGGNTSGSPYRVLRESPRGAARSVDRDCAGRNAPSVKGSSPDRQPFPWWPSQYEEAKAAPRVQRAPCRAAAESVSDSTLQRRTGGTTGVLDHGMYRRPAAERERSARGQANAVRPRPKVSEQGVTTKFKTIPQAEVRCSHSSEEVG